MPRKDLRPRHRLDAATRNQAILQAATDCFMARPYPEVSVAEIARQADASEALVYRYFGTKADLYTAVVRQSIEDLASAQRAVLAALHPRTPAKAKLRATLRVYLDHISAHPQAWAVTLDWGQEPAGVVAVRTAARAAFVDSLAAMLAPNPSLRHHYALWGYLGYLDGACLAWVHSGCPDADRNPLVESALGALEGALGDWAA